MPDETEQSGKYRLRRLGRYPGSMSVGFAAPVSGSSRSRRSIFSANPGLTSIVFGTGIEQSRPSHMSESYAAAAGSQAFFGLRTDPMVRLVLALAR